MLVTQFSNDCTSDKANISAKNYQGIHQENRQHKQMQKEPEKEIQATK
jgi:hypothetical protein